MIIDDETSVKVDDNLASNQSPESFFRNSIIFGEISFIGERREVDRRECHMRRILSFLSL